MNELSNISKSYYINLDRNPKRKSYIEHSLPFFAERFAGFDGLNVEMTMEERNLFKLKPPKNSKRFLRWKRELKREQKGCIISHYRLWKQLITDDTAINYFILEDDVIFKRTFVQEWNSTYAQNMPNDYLVIFPGGISLDRYFRHKKFTKPFNKYYRTVRKNKVEGVNEGPIRYCHMNVQSYIINKPAAIMLCEIAEKYGLHTSVEDYILQVFAGGVDSKFSKFHKSPSRVYHTDPQMAFQLDEINSFLHESPETPHMQTIKTNQLLSEYPV